MISIMERLKSAFLAAPAPEQAPSVKVKEVRSVRPARFLPGDGSPEEIDLQVKLERLFSRGESVKRAYLARVYNDDQKASQLVVCVRTANDDSRDVTAQPLSDFVSTLGPRSRVRFFIVNDRSEGYFSTFLKPFFRRD